MSQMTARSATCKWYATYWFFLAFMDFCLTGLWNSKAKKTKIHFNQISTNFILHNFLYLLMDCPTKMAAMRASIFYFLYGYFTIQFFFKASRSAPITPCMCMTQDKYVSRHQGFCTRRRRNTTYKLQHMIIFTAFFY